MHTSNIKYRYTGTYLCPLGYLYTTDVYCKNGFSEAFMRLIHTNFRYKLIRISNYEGVNKMISSNSKTLVRVRTINR